jgi:hypothetical protein
MHQVVEYGFSCSESRNSMFQKVGALAKEETPDNERLLLLFHSIIFYYIIILAIFEALRD